MPEVQSHPGVGKAEVGVDGRVAAAGLSTQPRSGAGAWGGSAFLRLCSDICAYLRFRAGKGGVSAFTSLWCDKGVYKIYESYDNLKSFIAVFSTDGESGHFKHLIDMCEQPFRNQRVESRGTGTVPEPAGGIRLRHATTRQAPALRLAALIPAKVN
jgi:hypothetical protein